MESRRGWRQAIKAAGPLPVRDSHLILLQAGRYTSDRHASSHQCFKPLPSFHSAIFVNNFQRGADDKFENSNRASIFLRYFGELLERSFSRAARSTVVRQAYQSLIGNPKQVLPKNAEKQRKIPSGYSAVQTQLAEKLEEQFQVPYQSPKD
jgi:hypothetical protein